MLLEEDLASLNLTNIDRFKDNMTMREGGDVFADALAKNHDDFSEISSAWLDWKIRKEEEDWKRHVVCGGY